MTANSAWRGSCNPACVHADRVELCLAALLASVVRFVFTCARLGVFTSPEPSRRSENEQ